MLERISELSLALPPGERCRGLAYDGSYFYITLSCRSYLCRLSRELAPDAWIKTARVYTAICWDPEAECFWAAAESCPATVYRLDRRFLEVDCMAVRAPSGRRDPITGLSYRHCDKALLVSFADGVTAMDARGCHVVLKTGRACVLGILAVGANLLCLCMEHGRCTLRLYRDGAWMGALYLTGDSLPDAGVLYPDRCDPCRILAVGTRRCRYPALWLARPCQDCWGSLRDPNRVGN